MAKLVLHPDTQDAIWHVLNRIEDGDYNRTTEGLEGLRLAMQRATAAIKRDAI